MTKTICDICKKENKPARRNYYPVETLQGSDTRVIYKHKIVDICSDCEIDALTNLLLETLSVLKCGKGIIRSLEYIETILSTDNKLENFVEIPWRKKSNESA